MSKCSISINIIKLSSGYFIFEIFGLNFNIRVLIFNFWRVKYIYIYIDIYILHPNFHMYPLKF